MNLTWGVSSKTDMPRTAYEYTRFFATEGEKLRISGVSSVPAYLPLASEWLTPEKQAKGYQVYLDAAKYAHVPGGGQKWDKISVLTNAELDNLFAGKQSAVDLANNLCPQVDRELSR
jgi:ABC-type glycerol-3-phosphate transport system substrate-binding protein